MESTLTKSRSTPRNQFLIVAGNDVLERWEQRSLVLERREQQSLVLKRRERRSLVLERRERRS